MIMTILRNMQIPYATLHRHAIYSCHLLPSHKSLVVKDAHQIRQLTNDAKALYVPADREKNRKNEGYP